MIKRVLDMQNDHHEIYCDSCHVQIATCCDWEFEEGQDLHYTPILCEKCGTEGSKDHGDKTQLLVDIYKLIKKMDNSTIERIQKVLDEKRSLFL